MSLQLNIVKQLQDSQDFGLVTQKYIPKKKSPYLSQYKSYFSIQNDLDDFHNNLKIIKQYQKQLKQNNFKIKSQEEKQFKIKIKKQSLNSKIIQIQTCFSIFSTSILILFSGQQSQIHNQISPNNKGSFGQIYCALFNNSQFAIKCQPICHQDTILFFNQKKTEFDNIPTIYSIIKEYFLCKLFSSLKIGPYINKICGFDIIIYKNCAQFSMQICSDNITNQLQSDLKESLLLFHKLKFVHKDIKPQNIMYSLVYEKNVLIDFGNSTFINQKIGEYSLTLFVGTLNYCSIQMRNLIKSTKQEYVDLYYNDLFAFIKSIKSYEEFQANHISYENPYDHTRCQKIQFYDNNQNHWILIFYYLFTQNYSLAKQYIQSLNIFSFIQIQKQLVRLLEELIPNQQLKFIYDQILSDFVKQEPQFCNIAEVYNKQLYRSCQYQLFLVKNYKSQVQNMLNSQLIWNQNYVKYLKQQTYFWMISQYICLTQNSNRTSLKQKTEICLIFLKNYPQALNIAIKIQQQIFAPLVYTFLHIIKNINNIFNCQKRYLTFKRMLSSLFLIKLKTQNNFNFFKSLLNQYHFTQKAHTYKVYFIFLSVYLNLQNMVNQTFVNQNQLYELVLNQTDCFQNKDFIKEKLNQNEIQNSLLAKNLTIIISQRQSIISQNQYQKYLYIINQEYKSNNQDSESCSLKTDFIESCLIILSYSGFKHKLFSIQKQIQQLVYLDTISKKQKFQSSLKIKSYSHLFIRIYEELKQFSKIKLWLKYFDLVVSCQQISFGYYLNLRVSLAYYFKDDSFLLKVLNFIPTICADSIHNVEVVSNLMQSFNQILITNQNTFVQSSQFKIKEKLFQPIAKKAKQISFQFLQFTEIQKEALTFKQFNNYSKIIMTLFRLQTFLKNNQVNLGDFVPIVFGTEQKTFSQFTQIFKTILKRFVNFHWSKFGPFWKKYFQLMHVIVIDQICQQYSLFIKNSIEKINFLISTQKISIQATDLIKYTIQSQSQSISLTIPNNHLKILNSALQFIKFFHYLKRTGQIYYIFKEKLLIKLIWQSFFILNICNQMILQFCKETLQFLHNFPSPSYLIQYENSMKNCFLTITQFNFNLQYQLKLKIHQLVGLIYFAIKNQTISKNFCYLLHQCLKIDDLNFQISDYFIKWISLNLHKVNLKLKQIILCNFYYSVMQKRKNFEIRSKIILGDRSQSKKQKKKIDNKACKLILNKKYLHLARRHLKFMKASQSLSQTLKKYQPFFISFQKYFETQVIKKVKKYHLNIGNYLL